MLTMLPSTVFVVLGAVFPQWQVMELDVGRAKPGGLVNVMFIRPKSYVFAKLKWKKT